MSKEAMAELPEFVSRAALAAALDLTPRRISSLVAEGILPQPTRHGMYPLVICLHNYLRYTRERATGAGVATETLASERAKLTRAKAAIAEMDRKRLLGELVSAEETTTGWVAILKIIRQNFLALPRRAAPIVALMSKPVEVEIFLRDRVHEILESTSQTRFVGVGVGAGSEAGDADDA